MVDRAHAPTSSIMNRASTLWTVWPNSKSRAATCVGAMTTTSSVAILRGLVASHLATMAGAILELPVPGMPVIRPRGSRRRGARCASQLVSTPVHSKMLLTAEFGRGSPKLR